MRRAALALLALAGWASAEARTRTYAVVVAQNRSLDPGVKPLQYADDDGVRTWELLSLYAEHASIFAVLDEDTARLHPEAARRAEVPERVAILARLARYNQMMARDRERGDEPELFFVYAGHGDVDAGGQGYINLHDGKMTRSELYREVIAPSRARFLHVVIDACRSYFMVSARGRRPWVDDAVPAGEDRSDRRIQAFLEAEKLERYPQTGVVVATSGDQETHEWSRYRGGILSHELRSALTGAADVNGDGKVEYSEARAFVAAANARVKLPQARIDVFARPPALDRNRPLVDLRRALRKGRTRLLHFGPKLAGRFHIEDDRGVRYADLNKEPGSSFDVLLQAHRAYFVRRDDLEETEIRPSRRARVDLGRASWAPVALAARGAVEQTFRVNLYQVPYGPRFYEGYVAKSGDVPVDMGAAGLPVAFERGLPRHSLSVGYALTPSPAGDAGINHGGEVRWAYQLRHWLDIGAQAQFGHGAGTQSALARQTLSRFALLFAAGAAYRPLSRLSLRIDAAAGWQIFSGTVHIEGTRVTGTELRGLRLELAGGLAVDLRRNLGLFVRGGIAADGAFPGEASTSLAASPFVVSGVFFRF
jgi:hypothetical protein